MSNMAAGGDEGLTLALWCQGQQIKEGGDVKMYPKGRRLLTFQLAQPEIEERISGWSY